MGRAEDKLGEGLHYEALQMIKALAARYSGQQKWDAAIELLKQGALKMAKYKQARCVLDLGDSLLTLGPDLPAAANMKLADAAVVIASALDDTSPETLQFISDALSWSKKADLEVTHPSGLPAFHLVAAKFHVARGDIRSASKHFVCAEAPEEFAKMTMAVSSKGYSSEFDLFIARAVLRLLVAGSGVDACRTFLDSCETRLASDRTLSGASSSTPLLQFCSRLLQALNCADSLPLYRMLLQVYGPALARDPSFAQLLARVSHQYYQTPMPQRAGTRGNNPFAGNPMMMNMMKMMGPMMGGRR